jgi:hypothetical protein
MIILEIRRLMEAQNLTKSSGLMIKIEKLEKIYENAFLKKD